MQLDRTSSFNPLQLTDFGYLDSFLSLSQGIFSYFQRKLTICSCFSLFLSSVIGNRERVCVIQLDGIFGISICVFLFVSSVCVPLSFSNKKSVPVSTRKADAPLSVKTGKSYTMASQRGRRSTLLPASDQLFILFSALLFLSGTNTYLNSFFGKNANELYRKSSLPYYSVCVVQLNSLAPQCPKEMKISSVLASVCVCCLSSLTSCRSIIKGNLIATRLYSIMNLFFEKILVIDLSSKN